MVFFTCNGCGESLKKAQVDKHVSMCRGCQVLSCIDCGKDFWGDDYKTHIKCISEDQKYGGKGYEAKANKGDMKQQQWLQKVHEAMNKPGVSAKLRDVLQQVSTYDNVPRKKAKFQNWMKNSLKIVNPSLQEDVWNILSTADNAPEATQLNQQTVATNGNESSNDPLIEEEEKKKKLNKQGRREARQQKNGNAMKGAGNIVAREPEQDEGGKKKKDRKRKQLSEEDEEQNSRRTQNETSSKKTKIDEEDADELTPEETEDQAVTKGKFNWKGNIKAILRESADQEMSVKKLRKKVLAAYYSFTGDRNFKTEEEVLALFNKKINKNPKLRVLKDKVRLVK